MPTPASLSFERSPAAWPALARALVSRRPLLLPAGATIPALEARLAPAPPDPSHLDAYRELCGFEPDQRLPITYPHVLAGPLHLALLTSPGFPLRLLGLVHLRSRIEAARALGQREPIDLRCRVGGHRETERGQEFDLCTEARAGGQVAWTETSTLLARRPGARPPRPPPGSVAPPGPATPPAPAIPPGAAGAAWTLGADLGRRYARVSGDYNPIHLSGPTARLFGFRRAIVHGMWTMARVAAELQPRVAGGPTVLEVAFKLPVLLPSRVTFREWPVGRGVGFAVLDEAGERPHATGTFAAG
jgi:acyl dehydratase